MKKLAPLALALSLAACVAPSAPPAPLPTSMGKVCDAAAALAPRAVAYLDALDPHSAAGELWLDVRAVCKDGKPATSEWLSMVWEMLKIALPYIIAAL